MKQLIPSAGAEALSLMRDMMSWDPHRRPNAQQVLWSAVVAVVVVLVAVVLQQQFYGHLFRTTRVSQKDKPFWILLKQR